MVGHYSPVDLLLKRGREGEREGVGESGCVCVLSTNLRVLVSMSTCIKINVCVLFVCSYVY